MEMKQAPKKQKLKSLPTCLDCSAVPPHLYSRNRAKTKLTNTKLALIPTACRFLTPAAESNSHHRLLCRDLQEPFQTFICTHANCGTSVRLRHVSKHCDPSLGGPVCLEATPLPARTVSIDRRDPFAIVAVKLTFYHNFNASVKLQNCYTDYARSQELWSILYYIAVVTYHWAWWQKPWQSLNWYILSCRAEPASSF